MKEIHLKHLNKKYKLGRTVPKNIENMPVLKAANYLGNLPKPPKWVNYTYKANKSLSDIYLNDELGDCVIACGYHFKGLATGNTGKEFIATKDDLLHDYKEIGGYIPGQPDTDQGCDLSTALNYWTKTGFTDGKKLIAWMSVDPTNQTMVQLCTYLFENLIFGVGLPDKWLGNNIPEKNGFTWDVAGDADLNNGHCFLGCGYNDKAVLIDTWGLLGYITYKAVAKYAFSKNGGELYVALTDEIVSKASSRAPSGFDWANLVNDFNALGGNV